VRVRRTLADTSSLLVLARAREGNTEQLSTSVRHPGEGYGDIEPGLNMPAERVWLCVGPIVTEPKLMLAALHDQVSLPVHRLSYRHVVSRRKCLYLLNKSPWGPR